MEKMKKMRLCGASLMVVTVIMMLSGIQLEILSGKSELWVWLHVAAGLVFFGLIGRHLYLHFRWHDWFGKLWKLKSPDIKWLTAVALLTLLTGAIATAGFAVTPQHSIIGAVHGKAGFLMIALVVWHVARRKHAKVTKRRQIRRF